MLALRFSVHIKMKLKESAETSAVQPRDWTGRHSRWVRECLALYQVMAARDQAAAAYGNFWKSPNHTECSQNRALERCAWSEVTMFLSQPLLDVLIGRD
jgi:hypothetical protein